MAFLPHSFLLEFVEKNLPYQVLMMDHIRYTPIILSFCPFNLTAKQTEATFSFILDPSSLNKLLFHAKKIPPAVPIAGTHRPLSYFLPNICLNRIVLRKDNFVSCKHKTSGLSADIRFLTVDHLFLSLSPLTF
jgi:hypothetical protein